MAAANNLLAIELHKKLRAKEGSLFLSPVSISTDPAMTYAGVNGGAEREIAKVLHLNNADGGSGHEALSNPNPLESMD